MKDNSLISIEKVKEVFEYFGGDTVYRTTEDYKTIREPIYFDTVEEAHDFFVNHC